MGLLTLLHLRSHTFVFLGASIILAHTRWAIVPSLVPCVAATTEEDDPYIHFEFELYVDNICADGISPDSISSATSLTPDTKARIEAGCLTWVQELADLPSIVIFSRNQKRPEDQSSDDFVELITTPDLNVKAMVVTSFEDGTSCDVSTSTTVNGRYLDGSGPQGERRLQDGSQSVAKVWGEACEGPCRCRKCMSTETASKGDAGRNRTLQTSQVLDLVPDTTSVGTQGNLTASLLEAGFKDVANVSFRNFRIVDCRSSSSECRGEATDSYSCCGAEGCKCKYASETLCASQECYIDDSLCCRNDPFDVDSLLYPECSGSDACKLPPSDARSSALAFANRNGGVFMQVLFSGVFLAVVRNIIFG